MPGRDHMAMTLASSADYQQLTSRFREWSLLIPCASRWLG